MPTFDEAFGILQSALDDAFGPAGSDFEGLEPFEAIVAVLLDRNLAVSSWRPVLDALREEGLLTPERMAEIDLIGLGDVVRQEEKGRSISAETLAPPRHLARWLVENHDGRVDSLFNPDRSTGWLRGELAAIKGVGIRGADAILLHALKRPSYPVDRATYRVLVRHDWLDPSADYDEARDLLVDQVTREAEIPEESELNSLIDLAHGMELLGHRFCRANAPHCDGCPLEGLLPGGGPRGAED